MFFQILDAGDLRQHAILVGGILYVGECQRFSKQLLALVALKRIALNDPAHPLRRQRVGVVLAFHQDELAVAAILAIGLKHSMSRGRRTGEAIKNYAVWIGC